MPSHTYTASRSSREVSERLSQADVSDGGLVSSSIWCLHICQQASSSRAAAPQQPATRPSRPTPTTRAIQLMKRPLGWVGPCSGPVSVLGLASWCSVG